MGGSLRKQIPKPNGAKARRGSRRPEKSNPLYPLLIESVSDYAIFALDSDGHVLSWNPGAQRFKGYTAEEIMGRHFSVFYPQEDLDAGKPEHGLEVASRDGRFEDEGWRIRKDGSRFWANVVITALRDSDGELVGFAKVTRDLTERRAAEEQALKLAAESAARSAAIERNRELKQLNQRLEEKTGELRKSNKDLEAALAGAEKAGEAAKEAEEQERLARSRAESLQQLTSALSVASTQAAVAETVIAQADRAFFGAAGTVIARRIEGREEIELVQAQDMSEAVFEQWRRMPLDTPAPLTDVVRTGQPMFLESLDDWAARYPQLTSLVEESGHRAQIIVPLTVAGNCIGSMGVAFRKPCRFTDEEREFAISVAGQCAVALERARLFDAERAARAIAESANMAKAQFLAAMSHELRTPLNAIAGHVELLSMGIHGPVTEPQRDALSRVRRAQRHLLGVINDLLNFARLERGKLEYRLETLNLQEVVGGLAPMIEPQVAAKRLKYEVSLPVDPVFVVSDHEKLVQILLNLVSNSVKFTPPEGTITIALADNTDGVDGRAAVLLNVVDTGIGIPTDKLQTIFDPFVQLSGHGGMREGTGLGLAISRDLARAMGGDLGARSTPGVATIFTLSLPLAEAQPAAATEP